MTGLQALNSWNPNLNPQPKRERAKMLQLHGRGGEDGN